MLCLYTLRAEYDDDDGRGDGSGGGGQQNNVTNPWELWCPSPRRRLGHKIQRQRAILPTVIGFFISSSPFWLNNLLINKHMHTNLLLWWCVW